jgi:hypothetical protein
MVRCEKEPYVMVAAVLSEPKDWLDEAHEEDLVAKSENVEEGACLSE